MKVTAFLIERFETTEALAVVDILRRAGLEVETVSLMPTIQVVSAQQVTVQADVMFRDCDFSKTDVFFLPGGPGTSHYMEHPKTMAMLQQANADGKWVTAICVAPSVLGQLGILKGRKATCYPGYEKELIGAAYVGDKVVVDGNIITGKGMGASIDMGLEMVRQLVGDQKAQELAQGIQFL